MKEKRNVIKPIPDSLNSVSMSILQTKKNEDGILKAIKKGSFKDDFGIDVECYVVNDRAKTAVISQRGMGLAIGLKDGSGRAFPNFVQGKIITNVLGAETIEKINNPLIFKAARTGADNSLITVYGYDVTILIDVCKAIIKAEDDNTLLSSQADIAKQAHVIVNASAKAGIKGLVYALSGYDATREEVITAFKLYVADEAREYEREFPEQLYNEWYRIYALPKPERNKPWKFMHLTRNQVYYPLAKSSGTVQELLETQKAQSGEKSKRLHQFLTTVGVKSLRQHLGQLLGIAQLSSNQAEYEKNFTKVFGDQMDLPFSD